MKKIFIILITIIIVAALYAAPQNMVILSKQAFIQNSKDLKSAISGMADNAPEVYYYDDKYVVAGHNQPDELPLGSVIRSFTLDTALNYYLFTHSSLRRQQSVPGEILFELSNTRLVASRLREEAVRKSTIEHFAPLELVPMVLRASTAVAAINTDLRTDVQTLVSSVNADSVMWFVQNLQDFQTRYALASNRLEVATWIRDQFIRFGISNATLQPFQWNGTTQYNVVATITGSINPDRYIIVGGHHDSVVQQGNPMAFAPGADDNATGTVAALEMARVMKANNFQPKNSIRFVTFGAEEFGLWGSKHYAQDALVSDQDILLMINHDMIGHSPQSPTNWQVRLMPYDGSETHTAMATSLTQQYTTLNPTYGNANSASSDSHPFWQRGYPVAYFFEQIFCPYYHSDLDIIDYVNGPYCAEVIKASTALAGTYGLMVSAPTDVALNDTGTGNSLRVSWTNSNDPAITSYRVYYNTTGTGFENPVSVSPMTGAMTHYTIGNLVQGTTYYVAVSSVDQSGNESYRIVVSGTPYNIPQTPANFVVNPYNCHIQLNWTANTELDLAGYRIYRLAHPYTSETVLTNGLVQGTQFGDGDIYDGANFFFYRICAVDTDGNESPTSVTLRSRRVSLDQGILIVDESLDGNGTPFQPNADQQSSFTNLIMQNFWHYTKDLELDSDLSLAEIGIAQSIFWHGYDQADFDTFFNNSEALRMYVALGGNLFFTSYFPSLAIGMNSGYPATFANDSILYQTFGIASAQYNSSARFKYANPQNSGFPPLTVDPDKTSASMNGHIFKVESIAAQPQATNIYFYGSDYQTGVPQAIMNGMPIGVSYNINLGKVVSISFPLYNMDTEDAQALVNHVFGSIFNAEVSSDDQAIPAASILTASAYPNPFVNGINVHISAPDSKAPTTMKIYNLKGQLVHRLSMQPDAKGNANYTWNALDQGGTAVANGIYFLKIEQGKHTALRKIMKLK